MNIYMYQNTESEENRWTFIKIQWKFWGDYWHQGLKQITTWRLVHLAQHQAWHITFVVTSPSWTYHGQWLVIDQYHISRVTSAAILFEGWQCGAVCFSSRQVSLGDVWFRGARLTWSIWSVCAPLALGWSLPIYAGVVVCAGGASTYVWIVVLCMYQHSGSVISLRPWKIRWVVVDE